MKRTLIAAAIAVAVASPAAAQIPVTDYGAIAQAMTQVQQGAQQIQQLTAQLQQLQATYQAFAHVTDLGSAVSALQMAGIQNPLPVNPGAVQSLLSGNAGAAGGLGTLGGLFSSTYSANHVYSPTDGSWQSQQMIANGNSIAGAEALSQQLYQGVSQQIPLMQQLLDRLNSATDPKDVMDLQARIQGEAAFVQSQQVQAQALTTWYSAQVQSEHQQQDEKRMQDIDALIAADPDQP